MKSRIVIVITLGAWWFWAMPFYGKAAAADVPQSLITIVTPTPGEVISGSTVTVKVKLPEAFQLVDPVAHPAQVEGQGHLHIWLDPVRGSALSGGDTLPTHADNLSKELIDSTAVQYDHVFSGLHTMYAEFFRNDHTAYGTKQAASVDFETVSTEQVTSGGAGQKTEAAPEGSGGLFLPHTSGTMPVVVILLIVMIALLWYTFGRTQEK